MLVSVLVCWLVYVGLVETVSLFGLVGLCWFLCWFVGWFMLVSVLVCWFLCWIWRPGSKDATLGDHSLVFLLPIAISLVGLVGLVETVRLVGLGLGSCWVFRLLVKSTCSCFLVLDLCTQQNNSTKTKVEAKAKSQ